jgi:competence protein ComEA
VIQRLAAIGQNRYIGAAVVGSLVGLILLLFFLLVRGQRDTVILQVNPVDDSTVVRVYVGGAVVQPGLYDLSRGSRVADAINAAGGPLTSADTAVLNLAGHVQDADQVIVPEKHPATPPAGQGSTNSAVTNSQATSSTPAALNPAPFAQIPTQPSAFATPTDASPININTADASELDRLPGIGPAISSRIVEYRTEHGPFTIIDDLSLVSGISARMVDEMHTLITVGD